MKACTQDIYVPPTLQGGMLRAFDADEFKAIISKIT